MHAEVVIDEPCTMFAVRPARSTRPGRLGAFLVGALFLLTALRCILLMAKGEGLSEGIGWMAVPATAVLMGLPLTVYFGYTATFRRNAMLENREGVLKVKNWRGQEKTFGLLQSMHFGQLVATNERRFIILRAAPEVPLVALAPGAWTESDLVYFARSFEASVTDHGLIPKDELRNVFAPQRLPYFINYGVPVTGAAVIGVFLYVGMVVNVFARL